LPEWRLVSNGRNRGKGYSVRHGMLEARGRIALFTDADLSSPIEECEKLLAAIGAGSDFAIGSRAIDRSLIAVRQARYRELAGILFNKFVRFFTGLAFHDTHFCASRRMWSSSSSALRASASTRRFCS
jgi:dolichyl-phosphate beta-glucosyltransferase